MEIYHSVFVSQAQYIHSWTPVTGVLTRIITKRLNKFKYYLCIVTTGFLEAGIGRDVISVFLIPPSCHGAFQVKGTTGVDC